GVNIAGPGAATLTVTSEYSSQGFGVVDSGVTASLSGLTISRNYGGIYNAGALTVRDCVVADTAGDSGILNYGSLTVVNSVLSGNSAADGGGIDNEYGTLTVIDSVFSGNSADAGGGISNHSGTVAVSGSTFAGNTAGVSGAAIFNDGTL